MTVYWLEVRFGKKGSIARVDCATATERALLAISLAAQGPILDVDVVGYGESDAPSPEAITLPAFMRRMPCAH